MTSLTLLCTARKIMGRHDKEKIAVSGCRNARAERATNALQTTVQSRPNMLFILVLFFFRVWCTHTHAHKKMRYVNIGEPEVIAFLGVGTYI